MKLETYIQLGFGSLFILLFIAGLSHAANQAYKTQHPAPTPAINWNDVTVTTTKSLKGEVAIIYVKDSIVCVKPLLNE